MMTTQHKALTKAQQASLDKIRNAIVLIERIVPQEQKRFSQQRKRWLENALESLRIHAGKFDIRLANLGLVYLPEKFLHQAYLVADALTERFAQEWRPCEKLTPTRARQLTQADFDSRNGLITTHEGSAPFVVGDYLAEDNLGEYPIQRAAMEQHYLQLGPPDAAGWASYRSIEQREARQQFRQFTTDCGATGQAGDYLMRGSDGRTWPCAREKFEQEYRFL